VAQAGEPADMMLVFAETPDFQTLIQNSSPHIQGFNQWRRMTCRNGRSS
jgi:hypothetical protein